MTKEDDYVYLDYPFHENYISPLKLTKEIEDNLLISFDRTIMGFKKGYVKGHDEKDKALHKLGYKELDIPNKVETEDDLKYWLFIAQ